MLHPAPNKSLCPFLGLSRVTSPSLTRLLVLVGFDAADVRGLLGHQDLDQTRQTVFELSCNLSQHQKKLPELGNSSLQELKSTPCIQLKPGSKS